MGTVKTIAMGFKEGFQAFGHGVTTVINTALLAAVYFVAVGPTSLAARVAGKEFLDLEEKKAKSHYEDLDLGKRDKEEYYSQF